MKFRSLMMASSFAIILGNSNNVQAQTIEEALLYSAHTPEGTARSLGFGNAVGSVGGDYSGVGINPAGLGIYRSSELGLSIGAQFGSIKGQYLNNTESDNFGTPRLNNFHVVINGKSQGDWRSSTFAIGMSKLNYFNHNSIYSGKNDQSSQSETFAYDANVYRHEYDQSGNFYEQSPAYLGYNSYLIDTFGPNGVFLSEIDYTKGILQEKKVERRGGMSEFNFAYGANYKDKILFGLSMGVPTLRLQQFSTFSEYDVDNKQPLVKDYHYNEDLIVNGSGINGKLGIIYQPVIGLRFGAAFHTPTVLSLEESYTASLYNNTYLGSFNSKLEPSIFKYQVRTPYKAVLSASYVFGKKGFLSVDYEFVDYQYTHFKLNTLNNREIYGPSAFIEREEMLNDEINSNFKAASNIRVGAELVLAKNFMGRVGYGYTGSPYQQNLSYSRDRNDFSIGFGYRTTKNFIDLAFRRSIYKTQDISYIIPYTSGNIYAPEAQLTNNINSLILSVGVKW